MRPTDPQFARPARPGRPASAARLTRVGAALGVGLVASLALPGTTPAGAAPAGASPSGASPSAATSLVPPLPPMILPGRADVTEGDAGQNLVAFPVTLSSPSASTVSARWSTVYVAGARDYQATPGEDYQVVSGTVTFAPGQTATSVAVPVYGDTTVEKDEYLVVSLTAPTNAMIGGFYGLGMVRVVDDDQQPLVIPGLVPMYEGGPGTSTVIHLPVTLTAPSDVTVSAEWATRLEWHGHPGQATPGGDYAEASGTVTFAPGQTRTTVDVTVYGDAISEGTEYIVVAFTSPTNARIGGFWGLGGIFVVDDDPSPST